MQLVMQNYPDNVVREFVIHSSEAGMDVFRIFDSLNYLPNLKVAMETVVEKTPSLCEAAVCFTGDFTDSNEEKHVSSAIMLNSLKSWRKWEQIFWLSRTWLDFVIFGCE